MFDQVRPANVALLKSAQEKIDKIGQLRGRPLLYPMLPTGRGSGPFIEMLDGSIKLDMITGIGVHLFGHGHEELLKVAKEAATKAPTMQGTLMPGLEWLKCAELLLDGARGWKHLENSQRKNFAALWLTTCGTMSNEYAVKLIRQKKFPAYKIFSFKNAFAGRSSTMQELTDEPKYREGQPVFDQFTHLDFYNSNQSLEWNIKNTIEQMDSFLNREPGKYAGIGFEPIQGEGGGFRGAPRQWWDAILKFSKSKDLGIWFDEVQTFGRTGELFAFQKLGLAEYVDIVTCAKPLQLGAVIWTPEFQPKPGLIAGTFAAATTSLAIGAKILELLKEGNFYGPNGKFAEFENYARSDWKQRQQRLNKIFHLGEPQIHGGMVAFEVLNGKEETIKKVLMKLFHAGVLGFPAGRTPVLIRFLPPLGAMTLSHWTQAMDILEKTLLDFAKENPDVCYP